MAAITDTTKTSSQSNSASSTQNKSPSNGFNDINSGQFMALLINELQNQDPLNPMDNSQMVQQIAQIRSIGSTDDLTKTLSTLRESQELVTASGLIGQKVEGLADDASDVNGVVSRVTVETDNTNSTRKVKVHVGDKTMDIQNIRTIQTG
jgi:flagellar basal-body rod modification protein FlgD